MHLVPSSQCEYIKFGCIWRYSLCWYGVWISLLEGWLFLIADILRPNGKTGLPPLLSHLYTGAIYYCTISSNFSYNGSQMKLGWHDRSSGHNSGFNGGRQASCVTLMGSQGSESLNTGAFPHPAIQGWEKLSRQLEGGPAELFRHSSMPPNQTEETIKQFEVTVHSTGGPTAWWRTTRANVCKMGTILVLLRIYH